MNITKQEFIQLATALADDYNNECKLINGLEKCGITIDYSFYNRALVALIEHNLNSIKGWVVEAIYNLASCEEYCIDHYNDTTFYSIEDLADYLYKEDE